VYQFNVPPAQPLAERLTTPGPQIVAPVVVGAEGSGFTVTVAVAWPVHPLVVPVTVYVVVVVGDTVILAVVAPPGLQL
jgi:hypothetical protein